MKVTFASVFGCVPTGCVGIGRLVTIVLLLLLLVVVLGMGIGRQILPLLELVSLVVLFEAARRPLSYLLDVLVGGYDLVFGSTGSLGLGAVYK